MKVPASLRRDFRDSDFTVSTKVDPPIRTRRQRPDPGEAGCGDRGPTVPVEGCQAFAAGEKPSVGGFGQRVERGVAMKRTRRVDAFNLWPTFLSGEQEAGKGDHQDADACDRWEWHCPAAVMVASIQSQCENGEKEGI